MSLMVILWFGKNGQKSIRMNVFSNKLDIIDMHWTTAMSRGTWNERDRERGDWTLCVA